MVFGIAQQLEKINNTMFLCGLVWWKRVFYQQRQKRPLWQRVIILNTVLLFMVNKNWKRQSDRLILVLLSVETKRETSTFTISFIPFFGFLRSIGKAVGKFKKGVLSYMEYQMLQCTQCNCKMRLPRNKGVLEVTCPRCKNTFRFNSGPQINGPTFDGTSRNQKSSFTSGYVYVRLRWFRTPKKRGADVSGGQSLQNTFPVSYTHLDVYKRQLPGRWELARFCFLLLCQCTAPLQDAGG